MRIKSAIVMAAVLLNVGGQCPLYAMVGGSAVTGDDTFSRHLVGIVDPVHGSVCTGTMIRQDVVLTAAHCFDGSRRAENYVAVFGLSLDPKRGAKAVRVEAIRIPPSYDPDKNRRRSSYDIALLKLAGKAPPGYVPATVGSKTDYFLSEDEIYIAAGYGNTSNLARDPGLLRKLVTPGKKLFVKGGCRLIELHQLGAGPCRGDSGSPLFKLTTDAAGSVSYTVIGVQSQAVQRVVNGKFVAEICEDIGLYTNVPPYRGWIEENSEF